MSFLAAILGFLTTLAVLAGLLLAAPVWLGWTLLRRHRLQVLLRRRGWPNIVLTPDLLIYPDTVYRRLPPHEEVTTTPLGSRPPAEQLKEVLHLLAPPGAQWVRL